MSFESEREKKEAYNIEDFVRKAKKFRDKNVGVLPYISSQGYYPCLRLESENVFYERRILKRFEKIENCEDFINDVAKIVGKNLSNQDFYPVVFSLRYLNRRPEKKIRKKDTLFLFGMGLFK